MLCKQNFPKNKRPSLLVRILLLIIVGLGCFPLQAQNVDYPSNQLVLKFKEQGASLAAVAKSQQIQMQLSDKLTATKQYSNFAERWTIDFPVTIDGMNCPDLESLISYLNILPEIEFAEPDYAIYLSATKTPNDPSLFRLWNMHQPKQANRHIDADIDAVPAWAIRNRSEKVVLSIFDSGVDWTHPDLVNNIWQNLGEDSDGDGKVLEFINGKWVFDPDDIDGIDNDGNGYIDDFVGWDFANNDNNPYDGNGHGTHVAGTIGAEGNNHIGVAGVTWDVQMMPIKIFDDRGFGSSITTVVEAITYAKNAGAVLSNHSWGSPSFSRLLYNAIADLGNSGHLVIAAAGNLTNNADDKPYYPAAYDLENIISVAATNSMDNLAYFSNYGKHSVDIAAPGDQIYSTQPQNGYGYLSGTSMAAPLVTGAVALMLAEFPELNHHEIKQRLLSSTDKRNQLEGKCSTAGRLNLHTALRSDLPEYPKALFSYSLQGKNCTFEALSPLANTHYFWDFGDGITTSTADPKHSYKEEGSYKVCLSAMNEMGTVEICIEITILEVVE